jgi:hypothetical protein
VDYINQGVGGVCATVIKEIGLSDTDFTSCSIIHEGRSSNSEAHGLTKHALGLCEGHHVWLINPPFYPSIVINIIYKAISVFALKKHGKTLV